MPLVALFVMLGANSQARAESDAQRLLVNGKQYTKLRRYTDALRCFDAAIAMEPKSYILYAERGEVYSRMQDFKSALSDFNKALALNDRASELYFKRGWAYDQLDDFEPAIKNYEKYLTYKPNDYFARSSLADNLSEIGQTDRALKILNEIIAAQPNYAQARKMRGLLLSGKNGNIKQAIEDYTVALKDLSYKHHINLLSFRADAYTKIKDYPHALADLKNLLKATPNDDNTHRKIANLYYLSGDYKKACDEYTRVIEMDSGEAGANYVARARCYEKLGEKDLARKDLEKSKKLEYLGKDGFN